MVWPSGQLVVGDKVLRIFDHVHLYEVTGLFQQPGAFRAEVAQVQAFTGLQITLGQGVDGLDGGVVGDTGVFEIHHCHCQIGGHGDAGDENQHEGIGALGDTFFLENTG